MRFHQNVNSFGNDESTEVFTMIFKPLSKLFSNIQLLITILTYYREYRTSIKGNLYVNRAVSLAMRMYSKKDSKSNDYDKLTQ